MTLFLQVVYLGGGCMDAAPEVREFIAKTQLPVAQTLMGLGAFPVSHPLSLQMLGMHGTVYANYAVDQVRPAAERASFDGWLLLDGILLLLLLLVLCYIWIDAFCLFCTNPWQCSCWQLCCSRPVYF
jgi:hypothetical protein